MTLKLQNKLYIGGAFVSGAAGTDRIINPANEDVIGEAPVGSVDDARSAVAAAHDAFVSGPWRRLSRHDRIAHMRRFYEALEHRKDEIIAILIAEAGATVSLANGAQWATGMKHFRYYMEAAAQDFTKLSRPEVTPRPAASNGSAPASSATIPWGSSP
ncbi:aldehyde dehydrogenase family protein [Rhizorhabdus histidinilytica]